MPDEIKSAVIAAMQDPQVSNAITDSVQKALHEKLQTALPDVVKGAVLGAATTPQIPGNWSWPSSWASPLCLAQ